jgi:CBS domain-containing protein
MTTNIHDITVIHGGAIEGASTGDQRLAWSTVVANETSAAPGTVGALMAHDVVCITREVAFETIVALLRQYRVGALPVVDDDGAPIGIVSKTDIVRVVGEGRVHNDLDTFDVDHASPVRTARDLMTPVAITLRESDDVAVAASRLRRDKIHHAPVIGEGGRIVGLLSTFDLLAAVADHRVHLED